MGVMSEPSASPVSYSNVHLFQMALLPSYHGANLWLSVLGLAFLWKRGVCATSSWWPWRLGAALALFSDTLFLPTCLLAGVAARAWRGEGAWGQTLRRDIPQVVVWPLVLALIGRGICALWGVRIPGGLNPKGIVTSWADPGAWAAIPAGLWEMATQYPGAFAVAGGALAVHFWQVKGRPKGVAAGFEDFLGWGVCLSTWALWS